MGRQNAFGVIKEIGVVPAIRPLTPEQALYAAEAICKGGIPIVEISFAVPNALAALQRLHDELGDAILLGAGSINSTENIAQARAAGADFIVTSGFSPETVAAAHELKLAILVGALTPTEVQQAAASRPAAVKLFPCYAVGGVRYVKSLHSQYPHIELVASGGVILENCAEYLRGGACAVGVGGEIGDSESMVSGDHRLFTERAKRFRRAVVEVRTHWRGARPSPPNAPAVFH